MRANMFFYLALSVSISLDFFLILFCLWIARSRVLISCRDKSNELHQRRVYFGHNMLK